MPVVRTQLNHGCWWHSWSCEGTSVSPHGFLELEDGMGVVERTMVVIAKGVIMMMGPSKGYM